MTSSEHKGIITPNGVVLQPHELATIIFFTELGFDIELIPKSQIKGSHKPNIVMQGLEWEIKSPKGEGKSLIKNTLQKALLQSRYIIIDLRRTKRHQDKCLIELKREFTLSKSIKRLMIITKKGKLIDLSR